MDTAIKLEKICQSLKARGEPGTLYQIARLLGVAPSTVTRWSKGQTNPRGKAAEALDVLYRTVVQAEKGNPEAANMLGAFLGGAGAALLGLGLGGVLIAAGLGWIIGGDAGENKKGEKK